MPIPTELLDSLIIKPPIRAVRMEVFPTMDRLDEVIHLAEAKLPITDRNALCSLLFTYHNTLLKVLKETHVHAND